ncbi:hypothetical protein IWZ03DRAFT_366877, partial [Phyllosticta citriasiana]
MSSVAVFSLWHLRLFRATVMCLSVKNYHGPHRHCPRTRLIWLATRVDHPYVTTKSTASASPTTAVPEGRCHGRPFRVWTLSVTWQAGQVHLRQLRVL